MPSAWDAATLATDDDLTEQESRMPELAMKVVGEGGKSAYDGKRALAKRDIGTKLRKLGYHTDGITGPAQFNRCAVFLELAYVYRDLAVRNDKVSGEKADFYLEAFNDEFKGLVFDYDPSLAPTTATTTRPLAIPLWRA